LPLDVRQAVLDGIKNQRIIAGAHADGSGGVCPMVAADVSDSLFSWRNVSAASVHVAQEAARAWDRYADASGSSRSATKRQLIALTAMLEASILEECDETEAPLHDIMAEFERARSRGSWSPPPLPRTHVPDLPVARRARRDLPMAAPAMPEVPAAPSAAPSVPDVPVAAPSAPAVPAVAATPPLEAPVSRRSSRPRRDTGERDRSAELSERGGWAWLRPFRSYDEYEETLLRALRELDSHERELEELQVR
jgi:hypothetical protein